MHSTLFSVRFIAIVAGLLCTWGAFGLFGNACQSEEQCDIVGWSIFGGMMLIAGVLLIRV